MQATTCCMQHPKVLPSELFTLCISRRWNEAIEYVVAHAKEASAFLYPGKRGSVPITALQTVLANVKCRGDAPIELIDALLKASPDLAFMRHVHTGNIPMHAVFYNPFFSATKRAQIAKLILQSSGPKAIVMINKDGRAPLHTICSQHCNFEPLSILLDAAPQVASWEDNHGNLPIHLACRSIKVPLKSIIILNNAYPKGIIHKNVDGLTPLQVAVEIGRSSRAMNSCTAESINSKARSLINFLTKMEASFTGSNEDNAFHECDSSRQCKKEETAEAINTKIRGRRSAKRKHMEGVVEDQRFDSSLDSRDDVEDSLPLPKRVKLESLLSSVFSERSETRDVEESHGYWSWVEEISPHILLSMKIETM